MPEAAWSGRQPGSPAMQNSANLPRPAPRARTGKHLVRLLRALDLAFQVRRERRSLLGMDAHMLKDLGLSGFSDAEASRPFWDVPAERLRAETACRHSRDG